MYCLSCGKEIPDGSKFCQHCGASQATPNACEESQSLAVSNTEISPIPTDDQQPVEVIAGAKKHKIKLEKRSIIIIIIAAVLIVAALVAAFFIYKDKTTFSPKKIDKLSDAVVKVEVYNKAGDLTGTGSGVVAYRNDVVITNHHVIDGDTYSIEIISDDNQTASAKYILQDDADKDLAILGLSAPTNIEPAKVGTSTGLQIGQNVLAIGSPLGLLNTASTGIISSFTDDKEFEDIQISAPISHGSSGGALFNTNGELIGITYAGIDEGQNLNFAIPIDYAAELWGNYENGLNDKASQKISEFYDDYIESVRDELTKCLENKDVDGYVAALEDDVYNEDIYDYSYHQLKDACDKLDYNAVKTALAVNEAYPISKLGYNLYDFLYDHPNLLCKSFLIGRWKFEGNGKNIFENTIIEISLDSDNELVGKIKILSSDLADSDYYEYSQGDVIFNNFNFTDDGDSTCDFVYYYQTKIGTSNYLRGSTSNDHRTIIYDIDNEAISIVGSYGYELRLVRFEYQ